MDKNISVSLARFVAMVFIVVCHFCQYYGAEAAWWFNVGVQMFFCISGFLYGNKNIPSFFGFVAKNFKKILVPYYCFLLPAILIYLVFAGDVITLKSIAGALLCTGTIEGIEHLWFIIYILFCYFITPFLNWICQRAKGFQLPVFFALLVVGFVIFEWGSMYFDYSKILCYLIGYFLAFLIRKYKVYTGVAVFTLTALANGFRLYVKYFGGKSFATFYIFEQYAHALLGISLFLLIYLFVKDVKFKKVLDFSDKYSYNIYLVHQLFILSPFTLMNITPVAFLNWIMVIVAVLLTAVLHKKISDKIILKIF